MALSTKQQAFIEEHLTDFNATQAAIRAGYSERTARSQGHRLLTNVDISEEISRRVEEIAMSADEVLLRLTEQARAEYGEYIGADSTVDLDAMIADGKAHLIKSIKETKYGRNVEFHDVQAALIKLGETHGLFKQKHEVGGTPGKPIEHSVSVDPIQIYIPKNGRE